MKQTEYFQKILAPIFILANNSLKCCIYLIFLRRYQSGKIDRTVHIVLFFWIFFVTIVFLEVNFDFFINYLSKTFSHFGFFIISNLWADSLLVACELQIAQQLI